MDQRHLGLLCDMGELSALLAGSADLEAFLNRTVSLVAKHLNAAVCSIYLYDETEECLVLRSNRGLSQDSVGRVKLALGEGLVGMSLKELRSIREDRASSNPLYRHFAGIDEELYESFLAVPVMRGVERIGVLVVQREESHPFDRADEMALRAIASQLAGAVEQARILLDMREPHSAAADVSSLPDIIRGKSASSGCVLGKVMVLDRLGTFGLGLTCLCDKELDIKDFRRALKDTELQMEELQKRVADRMPESAAMIFTAHIMMLKDSSFTGEMERRIKQGQGPIDAVTDVAHKYISRFAASPHAYVREKADDVEDVARRLLECLACEEADSAAPSAAGRIIIARELYPSDILRLCGEDVGGIILTSGGVNSHVSILARSLCIPLAIINQPALHSLADGTEIYLDAEQANIYIEPSADIRGRFDERQAASEAARGAAGVMRERTETADGIRVRLLANINLLSEIPVAREMKAEGIGLYRTEFPFLVRPSYPSEEEQYVIYRNLVERMDGREVTFRTLDVGGDKALSYYDDEGEENPALGLRSVRFSLAHRDIFRQQIRAILRAGAGVGKLRIMFPMISSLNEWRECRAMVNSCLEELAEEGVDCHSSPLLGMMIEVPSVVEIMDLFAAEVDFFSIGTNDFVQYMLAVDRTNERVADFYSAHHPGVLRSIKRIADSVTAAGKPLAVCGEMAHEKRFVLFFIGIGIRRLSVDPRYLPMVQQVISSWTLKDAERLAEKAIGAGTLDDAIAALDSGALADM